MTGGAGESNSAEAIEAVIFAGRRAAERGWTPATSGNFSVRSGDQIAITRTGRDKGRLAREDVALVSIFSPAGDDLSAETALHLVRYASDPRVGAVFHAHVPEAALLARRYQDDGALIVEGWELQKAFAGVDSHQTRIRIPILQNNQDVAALAVAAERELGRARSEIIAPGYLVCGHGVNTWGRTPVEAGRHLEAFAALLALHARWAGLLS